MVLCGAFRVMVESFGGSIGWFRFFLRRLAVGFFHATFAFLGVISSADDSGSDKKKS